MSAGLRSLIFLFSALLSYHAWAQVIPLAGNYAVEGVLMGGPARDDDAVMAYVNECGDEITIYHAELLEELVLRYDDGKYSGQAEIRAGTLNASLTPVSKQRLEGSFVVVPPNRFDVSIPVNWAVVLTFSGASEGDPPVSGYGGIVLVDSEIQERIGVFVRRKEIYRVALTNFAVRSTTLLPEHTALLDSVLETMMVPEMVPGRFCETIASTWNGPALGFADRRLERRNREAFAAGRARSLHEYVDPRFVSGNIGGGPGYAAGENGNAPGRGGACPRAAVAEFSVTREYADMYTREDVNEWYEEWLSESELQNGEDSVFDGILQFGRKNSVTRRRAKFAYCMGHGLIRMLEDDQCEIPKYSFAEQALKGRRHSRGDGDWRAYRGRQSELKEAADDFLRRTVSEDAQSATVSVGGGNDQAQRQERSRRRWNEWYRYATTCPANVKAEADRLEREQYGDVVPWDRVFDWTPLDVEGR